MRGSGRLFKSPPAAACDPMNSKWRLETARYAARPAVANASRFSGRAEAPLPSDRCAAIQLPQVRYSKENLAMTVISRRKFLGQTMTTTFGVAAGPTILANAASARGTPQNDKLILCSIGVGGRPAWWRLAGLCAAEEPQAGGQVAALRPLSRSGAQGRFCRVDSQPKVAQCRYRKGPAECPAGPLCQRQLPPGRRKLQIDAATEQFCNDPEAMGLFGRDYRKPWVVPQEV